MQNRNQLENAKPYAQSPYQKMDNPDNNQTFNQNELPPSQNRISEYAADLNQLKEQKSSYHWKTLIATIFLVGGQVTGIYLYFFSDVQLSQSNVLWICIGSYVLYLLIAFCCNPLAQYLSNISRGQNFEDQYQELRKKVGHFVFHAVCYHYETRHHTRIVRDSDGNTRTQHYTTQEKVVTHTATELLHPSNTRDESGAIDKVRAATKIIFVHYFVHHRFDSPMSQVNFNGFYESFKRRHNRDVHQNFSSNYVVPGLVQRKTYFVGELNCSYKVWYYIFGMFGFLWLYSIWVQCRVSRFRIDTMKILTV